MLSPLSEFKNLVTESEAISKEVSSWSVGQHLSHCCLAIHGILDDLEKSLPGSKKPTFHPLRTFVLTTGFIPRGKGRAPESVIPLPESDAHDLRVQIESSEKALETLEKLPRDHWWNHPVFGVLNARQSQRFIGVHNQHHLKVIRDILKSHNSN